MRCHLMVHYDVLSGFKALELNAQIPAHMEALQEAYSSEDPLDPLPHQSVAPWCNWILLH